MRKANVSLLAWGSSPTAWYMAAMLLSSSVTSVNEKKAPRGLRLLSLDSRLPSYRPQSLIYTVSSRNFWLGSWLHQTLVSLTSRILTNSSILEIRTFKKQLLQSGKAASNLCVRKADIQLPWLQLSRRYLFTEHVYGPTVCQNYWRS